MKSQSHWKDYEQGLEEVEEVVVGSVVQAVGYGAVNEKVNEKVEEENFFF